MIFAGVDAGSRAIKIVLLDGDGLELLAAGVEDQGVEQNNRAYNLLELLIEENNLDRADVGGIVATGYGRNLIEFADRKITEITCHAHGVRHLLPETRTIVEIGGQDSKVVRLNPGGNVQDFNMNDRCAAGTGRFLEVVAQRLDLRLDHLGDIVSKSTKSAAISSMCVVFAETEIIGLLATGVAVEDIVAGVQAAIASRVSAMAGRKIDEPVVFTGGVALIPGMKEALARALNRTVQSAPDPQLTGALGAAIMAARL
jgi:predicted CoA-substrate-specific enzyme activase